MNNFDKRNARKYFLELGGAVVIYGILIVLTNFVFDTGLPEPYQPYVALLPMLGFWLMIWAVVRMLGRIDELQKQLVKDDIFVAFWGTAVITFSYGFLEQVGFPKLSMFVVWGIMGGLWLLVWLVQVARMKINGTC